MNQIKCPKCGEVFTIDESNYQAIVEQIRNEVLEEELRKRTEALQLKFEQEKKLALAEANQTSSEAAETERKKAAEERERMLKELAELKEKLAQADVLKREELLKKEKEERENAAKLQQTIAELQAKLKGNEEEIKHAVALAEAQSKIKITELEGKLTQQQSEAELKLNELKTQHEIELKMKDETIAQYRDFKLSLSTKMVGESLEQFCLTKFNEVRHFFPTTVKFGKDNETVEGTKGDFIYRELDDQGNEILTIMFEMKNEMDPAVAKKHRNEDFFEKLHQDRLKKGCEYAVLVSMLEPDSEYYNAGIVDVSYQYPKMYVVRPQCFMAIISILRSAAYNALGARQELARVKQEQADVTHFEEKLEGFKKQVGRNFELAAKKYDAAIEELDKAIKALQKMREDLVSSKKSLQTATEQTSGITIRKLTHGNPTMKKLFDEAREANENTIDTTVEENE